MLVARPSNMIYEMQTSGKCINKKTGRFEEVALSTHLDDHAGAVWGIFSQSRICKANAERWFFHALMVLGLAIRGRQRSLALPSL